MHPALSTFTHLHPAPSTYTQIISTATQLHPPPLSSFHSPPSSLQHPQQYLNQNIARNWAISPNLSLKIKSCIFRLEIGTHGILEVLILNPDLDLWNFDQKINFWANLSAKIQTFPFCLKIGTLLIANPDLDFWNFDSKIHFGANFGILEVQIPNLDLDFWNSDPKIYFWANLSRKSQSCPFFLIIGTHDIFTMLILSSTLAFWISDPKSIFEQIWVKKVKVFVLPEKWYTRYIEIADSYSKISFLNFKT